MGHLKPSLELDRSFRWLPTLLLVPPAMYSLYQFAQMQASGPSDQAGTNQTATKRRSEAHLFSSRCTKSLASSDMPSQVAPANDGSCPMIAFLFEHTMQTLVENT